MKTWVRRFGRHRSAVTVVLLGAAAVLPATSGSALRADAAPSVGCAAGTQPKTVVWGASGGVVWNDSIQDTGLSHTYPLGNTGVNMTMSIDDPNQRNEDANSPLVNLPISNWDAPIYTKTDGAYGNGYLTLVMNSLNSDETVTMTLDYDRPVLIPDFSIGDVDFTGNKAPNNTAPHDSFQDEILVSAHRSGTPVGFDGTTGATGQPVITLNDPTNGQFAVAGGPYSNSVNGNLNPGDAPGTVYLSTLDPVTSISFAYSNGPDDVAGDQASLTEAGGTWPAANWTAPMTNTSVGVSNNHAVRVNNFTVCTGTMKVGDKVWADIDGDGQQDVGEPGIGGVEVELVGDDGIVLDTTTTDGNGGYLFDRLPPWDYTVRITPPDGYTATADLDGEPDNLTTVTLSGADRTDVDFGLKPPAGKVDGTVFKDGDNDGIYEPGDGDSRLAGVTVTLEGTDLGGNPVSASTVTDDQGYFSFEDVPAGNYTLTETQPTGYADGIDTPGTNATTSADDVFDIALSPGQSSLGNDLAELGGSSLSGTVMVDLDNDGRADPGEAGIEGVTMTLTGTEVGGATVDRTAATDSNGDYTFSGLAPGTYRVTEGATPGYLDGAEHVGSEGGTTADDELSDIVLAAGTDAVDYDFGEVPPAGVSGRVTDDAGDGIGNVTLTVTGSDDRGASVERTTTTDGDGNYSFTDLRPGTYEVVESQPAGYGDGGETAGPAGGDVDDDRISGIVLAPGATAPNNDFDETRSSIAGKVVDDEGAGIEGVTVELTGTDDRGNDVARSTTTDSNGNYRFGGLLGGTYAVRELQPVGYGDGGEDVGSEGGTVADDHLTDIDLPVGTDAVHYDFDETRSSLSGTVVVDVNGDGVADEGEEPIEGVEITLLGTDATGATVERTATTDSAGDYTFAGLLGGTYSLTEGPTPGYVDGKEHAGSVGGSVGDDLLSDIVLPNGTDGVDYDFGETLPASISGSVVDDAGHGIPDTELVLTGTDVYANTVLATTTTDADGNYRFADLAPGSYTVNETQPAGYGDGGETAGSTGGTLSDDQIAEIELGGGEQSTGNDFDETRSSLAGTVYHDLNDNGVQDADEPGIEGVRVELVGRDDRGQDVARSAETDGNGNYRFDGLLSGDYLAKEIQPAEYGDGADTAGTSGGDDTSVNDEIGGIALAPGVDATDYDFGELGAFVRGTVWIDTNGDGVLDEAEAARLGDIELTLLDADGKVVATTTTAADGTYAFGRIPAGEYTVVQTQPEPYGTTTPNTLDLSVPVEGLSEVDYGEKGGSLEGRVWDDDTSTPAKGDGIDQGEPGVAGVTVELRNGDGDTVATTTTDDDGNYRFDDLPAGSYVVVVIRPDDEAFSPRAKGDDDTVDSDVDLITGAFPVSLNPGEDRTDIDAGLQQENRDLAVAIELDTDTASIGDVVTYTVTGSNSGNVPVEGVQMVTTLPEGTEYVGHTAEGWDCEVDGLTVTCTYDEVLMPGESAPPVKIEARVLAAGSLAASATISPLDNLEETTLVNNDDSAVLTVATPAEPTEPPTSGPTTTVTPEEGPTPPSSTGEAGPGPSGPSGSVPDRLPQVTDQPGGAAPDGARAPGRLAQTGLAVGGLLTAAAGLVLVGAALTRRRRSAERP